MIQKIKSSLFSSVFLLIFLMCTAKVFAQEVKQSTTITYTIKKGDTLWGLSKKFFDTPWYWPGLWSENQKISNPHWIYPGQQITLYNRTEIEKLLKTKPLKTKAQAVIEIKKTEKQPEIKPSFVFRKINKLPFISKKIITPAGIIKRGVNTLDMYSTTDEIYIIIKDNNKKYLIGKKLAVYKKPVKVKNPVTGKKIGYQYDLAAIVEPVKKEGKLIRAVITDTYLPVNDGDLITKFNEISPDIFIKPSPKNLRGRIIKEKQDSEFMGEKSIAFINAGKDHGVKRGQIYTIIEEQKIKVGKKVNSSELIPFGSFVVLDPKETTSSVLIIEAEKQVEKGAEFISPAL